MKFPSIFGLKNREFSCFDKDGNELGLFEYANHERFIALKNPQVPSLAYKGDEEVEKMTIDPINR